jgi:predicted RNase H-like HicB family nuclease
LTKASYLGVVRKEPHTDYWVDFPDIPGCVVGAGSVDELAVKAPAVLQLHIRAVAEGGGLIPTPRAEQDIVASETEAFLSIIPVEVDVP